MFQEYISNIISTKIAILLRGQLISLLIAGTGVFATLLSLTTPSTNFPTFLNLLNYILLSSYLIRQRIKLYYRKQDESKLQLENEDDTGKSIQYPKVSLWWYLFAAFLDVEANYLVLLAYNYTTVTSIMLLDCVTIPCAMILSYFFLSYRYTYRHIFGASICFAGLSIIVITDSVHGNYADSPENASLGDLFCIMGSILYASSNVLQESIVKFHDREEYLGTLGCFGTIIAFIQCMIVDYPSMRQADFSGEVIGYIIGFVICLFLMYVNTSMFLIESDAALFNLSLLTSDVYAVIFSYFVYHQLVYWTYFLAFLVVAIGLYVYHKEIKPIQVFKSTNEIEDKQDEIIPVDTNMEVIYNSIIQNKIEEDGYKDEVQLREIQDTDKLNEQQDE